MYLSAQRSRFFEKHQVGPCFQERSNYLRQYATKENVSLACRFELEVRQFVATECITECNWYVPVANSGS